MVGVHAADDRTLVVTLARPTPYFLDLCQFVTFFPVHPRSVAARETINPDTGMLITDSSYWSDPSRLVCNGPYVLVERRFKQDLLMKQNPRYWNRAAMRNHSIRELVITNPQTALMMYDDGQADWLPDIPSSSVLAADLLKAKRQDVLASPWVGTYFYNFNCQEKLPDGRPNPLHDPRVRRALSLAIDRRTIVERVTRVGQPIARTFIPPGTIRGYDPPVEAGSGFDPPAARKLLIEAGYPDGAGLTGLSIMYNTGGGHELIAQQIKRTWEQTLGVAVALEAVEGKGFSQRLKGEHNYTIARASWIGDYPDPTTFLDKFRSTSENNDAGYDNPAFDRLMDEAEGTPGRKRLGLLREAEAVMLRDQPIAPIYHYITLHVFDPSRVKYMYPNAWNYRRLELVEVVKKG
jgi:oligopeptide transport system substrate-binding protein